MAHDRLARVVPLLAGGEPLAIGVSGLFSPEKIVPPRGIVLEGSATPGETGW